MRLSQQTALIGGVIVLLLATGLGAAHLTYDAIWFDEWITYFISGTGEFDTPQVTGTYCAELGFQSSLTDTLCLSAIDNSWPPAFFLMLKLWDVMSQGNIALDRLLALLIGLIAIAAQFQLGRRLFGHSGGLQAAALLATSALMLFYMHEMRGYTLYVLAAILCGWTYWLLLDKHHFKKRSVRYAFVASIALALYSHYVSIGVVLGIAIYHVVFERPKSRWNNTLAYDDRPASKLYRHQWQTILKLGVNGCLLYTPWIAVLIISFFNESITERSLGLLPLMQGVLYSFSNDLSIVALVLLMMAATRWRYRAVRFLWVWSLTSLVVAMLGNLFADFLFHPRHLIGLLPIFLLLVLAGIRRMQVWQPRAALLILTVWLLMGGYQATQSERFMLELPRHIRTIPAVTMQQVVDTVKQCTPDEALLIIGIDRARDEWVHDQPLTYYLDPTGRDAVQIGSLLSDEGDNPSVLLAAELRGLDYQERVSQQTRRYDDVWVLVRNDIDLGASQETLDGYLINSDLNPCDTLPIANGLSAQSYQRGVCEPVSCELNNR